MIEEFKAFIANQQLFSVQDHLILAVSGGIDSVVMLDLFARAGYSFAIGHCNFRLRGQDSEEDEAFARSLADQYGVPCFVKRFDTVKESEKTGASIQMAARRLRYQWFDSLLEEENFQWVATAHQKNDVLETLLFNLCKGTGIAGLHGIPVKSDHIVRPLLFAERKAIEIYARQHALVWREDSSNVSVKYARNLIRLEVTPRLLKINPNLLYTLDDTLDRLQGTETIFQAYVEEVRRQSLEKKGKDIYLSLSVLRSVEALPVVLAEILKPFGFYYVQAKAIATQIREKEVNVVGKIYQAGQYTLNIDRNHLLISPLKQVSSGVYQLEKTTKILTVPVLFTLRCQVIAIDQFQLTSDPLVAALDLDKLRFPLLIRPWQAGDWFHPMGMKGKKKLSDFMIDHKIPLNLKGRIYVLTSGEAIVWVMGYHIDDRFKLTHTTRQVFQIIQQNLL